MSHHLAHVMAFSDVGPWQAYRRIARLIAEGYISEHVVSGLGVKALQLTKKGFSLIRYDLGDLKELRFNPQSVTHDYWATAFQLGPFVPDLSDNVNFVTEQEVQAFDSGVLPPWLPQSREHIPDGFISLGGDNGQTHIALEVELNLKPPHRYDKVAYYFDVIDSPIELVFWLCGNFSLAETIFQRLVRAKLRNLGVHHFFILDEYRQLGWQAPARTGQFKNKTIQEILTAKQWQNAVKMMSKQWQKERAPIFFQTTKSPQNQMR